MTVQKHVAVLKGGWSAEREVSLVSGDACAKALREVGYRVTEIDMKPDVAEVLKQVKPDVVFNALHGRYGEDGCVQGLLELMSIPYTHSGVLASSVAMDKPMAKRIFEAAGLRCPRGVVLTLDGLLKGDPMPRPFVVKPAAEGSSVGVHVVLETDNRPISELVNDERKRPAALHQAPALYLVEQYIPGRELTVAVLNGKALGVTEIITKAGFYDYENKYTAGGSSHILPAKLPKAKLDELMEMAVTAHKALGCRGLSRTDFRYDDTKGEPKTGEGIYVLEINTQPGMTPLSLSPEIAAHAGISFQNLVQMLVEDARLGD